MTLFEQTIEEVKEYVEIGDPANLWLAKDTLFGEYEVLKDDAREQTKVFNHLVRAVNEFVTLENKALSLCVRGRYHPEKNVRDELLCCIAALRLKGKSIVMRCQDVARVCHEEEEKL